MGQKSYMYKFLHLLNEHYWLSVNTEDSDKEKKMSALTLK